MSLKYDDVDFNTLTGQTIKRLEIAPNEEEVIFYSEDGRIYRMRHRQDCCENVYLESSSELENVTGSPITMAYESSQQEDTRDGSQTWTFYRILCKNGTEATLRWLGISNGYYSERVNFERIDLPRVLE